MGQLIWALTCALWVLVPVLAWLPGVSARLSLPWWFGISSLVVIAVGLRQPILRKVTWSGVWLLGCLSIFWLHQTQFGLASKFLMGTVTALVATHLICERGHASWVRAAILLAASVQISLIWGQHVGTSLPYVTAGTWPWGSLGDRIDLGILWGIASLLTKGLPAWGFAGMTLLTGSLTGSVPALGRLIWEGLPSRRLRLLVSLGLFSLMVLLVSHGHFVTRWHVWTDVPTWDIPLIGYGFLSFPGGFTYDDALSQLIGLRDTHSVWMDWLVRTGVLGAGLLAAALIWFWRRSQTIGKAAWFCAALWIGTWQSLEARPLMSMAVWWWIVLQEASDGRVDS